MILQDELNFLPDSYRQQKVRRRLRWLGGSAFTLALATTAILGLRARSMLFAEEKTHARIESAYDEATGRFNRLCQEREAQRQVIQQAALACPLIENVPRSNILAELTNCLPDGVSLVELNIESRPGVETTSVATTTFDMKKAAIEARLRAASIAIPEKSANEIAIKISGLADTDVEVAHYLSELNRSPLFRDANLLISEGYAVAKRTQSKGRRFQIQLTVNPNVKLAPRAENPMPLTADLDE